MKQFKITPSSIRGLVWVISASIGIVLIILGKDASPVLLLASTVAGGLGIVIKDNLTFGVDLEQPSTLRGIVWVVTSLVGWVLVALGKDITPLLVFSSGLAGGLGIVIPSTTTENVNK